MITSPKPQDTAYRQAITWALVLSFPLLIGACLLIAGIREGTKLVLSYPLQEAGAFGGMFAYGRWAAPRWGSACARHSLLAGLFAVSVFLLGVLSGSVASMVIYRDFEPFDYIVKPLYWIGLLGFLPAFGVGVIGSVIARRLVRNQAALRG